MKEIWKNIVGYETKYEISSLGNIRSKTRKVKCSNGYRTMKGKQLKQQVNKTGYLIIGLSTVTSTKTYTVHSLVMESFDDTFIRKTQINHINGNKQDNRLINLEKSDASHNQLHAVRIGLRPKVGKSIYHNVTYLKNPRAKRKWAASIRTKNKKSYGWKTFFTEIEAAKHVDMLLEEVGDTQRLRNFP